jgi:hypothetical protein
MADVNPDEAALEALEKAESQITSTEEKAEIQPETSQEDVEGVTSQEDEVQEETSTEGQTDESELTEQESEVIESIDQEALQYLRGYYSDDKEILRQLQINPQLADDILSILDEEVPQKPEQKPEQKQEVQAALEELKFELDPDIVGPDVKNAIDQIASVLNEQRKGLSEEQKKLQSDRAAAFDMRIDDCFDRYSKELPNLGQSGNLSNRNKRFRTEMFAYADVTSRLRGVPIERAIAIEIEKFKNQGGKKAATQELIDKLNQQEKRMINRPTRRQSQQKGQKKYADAYEEADEKMALAEQEAGLSP